MKALASEQDQIDRVHQPILFGAVRTSDDVPLNLWPSSEENMKAFHLLLAVPVASLAFMTAIPAAQQPASAPVAKKVPHTTKIHGYTLKDDYFWLRGKANPEVTTYLEAENAYTEEVMKPTKALQETLYKEMLGHIKQTDLSVPVAHRRVLLLLAHRGGQAVSLHVPHDRAAWTGRKRSCSTSTSSPKGHKFLGLGALRGQRRRQLAGVFDRHDRLSAVSRCT